MSQSSQQVTSALYRLVVLQREITVSGTEVTDILSVFPLRFIIGRFLGFERIRRWNLGHGNDDAMTDTVFMFENV